MILVLNVNWVPTLSAGVLSLRKQIRAKCSTNHTLGQAYEGLGILLVRTASTCYPESPADNRFCRA